MRNLLDKYLIWGVPHSVALSFNAQTVAPNIPLEPVPSAIYDVIMTASEEKGVKDSDPAGQTYYEFEYTITLGDYKGRKLYDRLNIKNANAKAVEIAYGTLSAICHVTGVLMLNNTAELHNKPMKINVIKAPRGDDKTRFTNEIRGYLDLAGNPPKGNSSAAQPAASTTQAAAFGGAPAAAAPAPAIPGVPAAAVFPPEGWQVHPSAPGWYYKGQEVVTEADLRDRFFVAPTAPAVPAAPAVPGAPGASAGTAGAPAWAQA